jgi:hypothetical protein
LKSKDSRGPGCGCVNEEQLAREVLSWIEVQCQARVVVERGKAPEINEGNVVREHLEAYRMRFDGRGKWIPSFGSVMRRRLCLYQYVKDLLNELTLICFKMSALRYASLMNNPLSSHDDGG